MRTYVQTTWNDADKFAYNGAQQHFRANGSAAIENYADEDTPKKAKKVKKPDMRTKEQAFEDRLDARRVAFEKAFENGEISFEQYDLLLTEWTKSRARLDRRMEIVEDVTYEPAPVAKIPIINHIEDCARSFAARRPFMFLVASIMVGAGILNCFGFGS